MRARPRSRGPKIVLGSTAIILLPALKIRTSSPRALSYQEEIHAFLIDHYDGYTVAAGNITGYWRDARGKQQYGEHLQYRVALKVKKDLAKLEVYLAELAHGLKEESIYLETGKTACLILAKKATRTRARRMVGITSRSKT